MQKPLLYTGATLLILSLIDCSSPTQQRGLADTEVDSVESVVTQTSQRPIRPADIATPDGLQITPFAQGLTYPVDVAFDSEGTAYIAEAGGHTYGTSSGRAPKARILRRQTDGTLQVLYDKVVSMTNIKANASSDQMDEGLIPPITGITYHEGKLFISHRSRYSVYDLSTGEFKTIVNGLPSWGEFLNGKPIFQDGKMVFFLSSQGNSGVIEEHWVKVMDQFNKPDVHEIPGEDITLTGQNFWVPTHEVTLVEADSLRTGAYLPLGTESKAGQAVPGQLICNGAFFRCNPDGSDVERLAWGLRSSFGYRYSPDGRLIATMNSANPMPPRGMYFDYEPIYEIVEGEWYGWPDFYSGLPITDERFGVKPEERGFVLTPETHQKLLKGEKRPRQPLVRLPVHSAAQGMVFGQPFGLPDTDILVAEFGAIVPFFKGEQYHPHRPTGVPPEGQAPEGVRYNWPGFRVQRVNLNTGEVADYLYNRSHLPASVDGSGGLERPLQLSWGPDQSLYIVDFGVVDFDDGGMSAHPFTGVIWRVASSSNP